eukprot:TRINITY_DN1034_c1_g4_i2.p1 TRINITY_DN1034_c1_g4~~TRINITY_DN1034_c1_g4_i2.p1  ORF type:complete len:357 (-),score=80.30 TRINITY_DN1034_c1_g4_i2:289-1359(-)
MTMEMAYTLACITNRTFVLANNTRPQYPYWQNVRYEFLYDVDAMKSGWPTLTIDEYVALPNHDSIEADILVLNWTDISHSRTAFAWPHGPSDPNDPHWVKFLNYRRLSHEGIHVYSSDYSPNFNTVTNLNIPLNTLFGYFYMWYYFAPDSHVQLPDITRLVRDHLHVKEEIVDVAKIILKAMPNCFSSMHYRRDDLAVSEARNIDPAVVFNHTYNLFEDHEDLYISTDEKSDVFKNEFKNLFVKRYRLHYLSMYKHLIPSVPGYWEPLIEKLICSQGRVFVGTKGSTYTGYIHRLRGYMKVPNTEFYFTNYDYPSEYENPKPGTVIHDSWVPDWQREYSIAFKSINDDDNNNEQQS